MNDSDRPYSAQSRVPAEPCQCEWSDAHFDDDSNGRPQVRTMHAYGDAVADGPSVVFIGRICQACADAGHDKI